MPKTKISLPCFPKHAQVQLLYRIGPNPHIDLSWIKLIEVILVSGSFDVLIKNWLYFTTKN